MKTFPQLFADIERQGKADIKPLGAKLGKLMEEVGELAEGVNIHQGFITHKEMKEPLVGEVADVVQNALAILVDATPELSKKQRIDLFLYWLDKKNQKWAAVQEGDAKRIAASYQVIQDQYGNKPLTGRDGPNGDATDLAQRVYKITGEQLGVHRGDIKPTQLLVEDFGADSLDLVELCMAIEDEFDMEIPDDDAIAIKTVHQMVTYVQSRFEVTTFVDQATAFDIDAVACDEPVIADEPVVPKSEYYDPAADYTEKTGRHLTLEERIIERSLFKYRGGDV